MNWTDDNKRQGRDGDVEYTEEQLETFDKVWLGVGLVLLVPSAIAMLVGMGYTAWHLVQTVWGWM